MTIKSEVIWAILLIGTAAVSYYLGMNSGILETEENLKISLEQKTETITTLENKIQQLSEELTSRGIYSYPQANVVSEDQNSNASILIHLNGREPVMNLEIERKQVIDYTNQPNKNFEHLGQSKKTSVGNLNAHNPVAFELDSFKEEIAIDLKFKSDANKWRQYIRTKKTPEGEIKTFWVITNGNSTVIDKHIDEGFPVDNNGKLVFAPDHMVKYSEIKMNSVFHPYSTEKLETN